MLVHKRPFYSPLIKYFLTDVRIQTDLLLEQSNIRAPKVSFVMDYNIVIFFPALPCDAVRLSSQASDSLAHTYSPLFFAFLARLFTLSFLETLMMFTRQRTKENTTHVSSQNDHISYIIAVVRSWLLALRHDCFPQRFVPPRFIKIGSPFPPHSL